MAASERIGLLEHSVVPSGHESTTLIGTGTSENDSSSQAAKDQQQKDQALKDLRKFQAAVGIGTPDPIAVPSDLPGNNSNLHASLEPSLPKLKRPAENRGIYTRIVALERRRKMAYYMCTALIETCFLAQIAFAAMLTALGAATAPHNVITIFGAINTAIAGILAILKGQGLPDRLRQDWAGLTKVRDFIEERERFLEQGFYMDDEVDANGKSKQADIKAEIAKVLDLYETQLATMEANRPATYVYPGAGMTTGTAPLLSLSNPAGQKSVVGHEHHF